MWSISSRLFFVASTDIEGGGGDDDGGREVHPYLATWPRNENFGRGLLSSRPKMSHGFFFKVTKLWIPSLTLALCMGVNNYSSWSLGFKSAVSEASDGFYMLKVWKVFCNKSPEFRHYTQIYLTGKHAKNVKVAGKSRNSIKAWQGWLEKECLAQTQVLLPT